MQTIKFYDSRGELRDTRTVSGKLRSCDLQVTGLVEDQEFGLLLGHCPFSGGWMEIE